MNAAFKGKTLKPLVLFPTHLNRRLLFFAFTVSSESFPGTSVSCFLWLPPLLCSLKVSVRIVEFLQLRSRQ